MLKTVWCIDVTVVNWIPLLTFSWCMLVTSLGVQVTCSSSTSLCFSSQQYFFFAFEILQSVAITVVVEIMPQCIKSAGVTFCIMLMWIFAFVNIKFLPSLTGAITFHGAMFLYTAICSIGAVIIWIFLPETKAKSHEEIMKSLQ